MTYRDQYAQPGNYVLVDVVDQFQNRDIAHFGVVQDKAVLGPANAARISFYVSSDRVLFFVTNAGVVRIDVSPLARVTLSALPCPLSITPWKVIEREF